MSQATNGVGIGKGVDEVFAGEKRLDDSQRLSVLGCTSATNQLSGLTFSL